MSRLKGLGIRDSEYIVDRSSGQYVYHARDPHALTQAAGYLTYLHAHKDALAIHFRGQGKMHAGLIPSLFRGSKSEGSRNNRLKSLSKYIHDISSKHRMLGKLDAVVVETLMQHYGIRSTWVDMVENIWIALWFACHKARFSGEFNRHLHFEKRTPRTELPDERFAYILLIGTEITPIDKNVPGWYKGKNTELIDLRKAAPSIFLRPHSQHGVLFRLRGDTRTRLLNYGSSIKGVIRVSLEDALEWLGSGTLLNVHALFPPPLYDQGFGFLLSDPIPGNDILGAISNIGA